MTKHTEKTLKSLLCFALVTITASVMAGEEHPSEHPAKKSEHPEHPAKKPEHPEHPEHPTAKKQPITKADISAGIQAHINDRVKEGMGKYRMDYEGSELALTLVKVHEDKLAHLETGSYFACTDLEGDDGNTYDVDFFLVGEPGSMAVTEASVHKINGKPLYQWMQSDDGNWMRTPVDP